MIFYPIETIVAAGITDIAITYNPGTLDGVKSFLGDGSKWSAKFTYVLQEEPKGLANVVQVCEGFLRGDSFIFHLGDNIFTEGVKPLVYQFHAHKPHGLLGTIRHSENVRLGVPFFDKKGDLVRYVEKPKNPPHDLAVPGIYLADSTFFGCFKGKDAIKPSARGEYEIPDAYQWMIDHGLKVLTCPISGHWLDPGKFDDWLDTNQYLLDHQTVAQTHPNLPTSVKITGRVSIGKSCHISSSEIRGPVSIGAKVTIKNSFIGPFTSIYNDCVLVNCRIENSVLMESVHLADLAKPIDSSIFGPHTQVTGAGILHHQSHFFIGELSQITI